MMKIIIIGNNVAGTFSAQNIRNLNDEVEIEIFTQESYPYYTRVNLPELIPGKTTIEDLIVFKEDWYKNKNLKLYLNKKAIRLDTENKFLYFEGVNGPVSYDRLILALGSTPNIPPIKNALEMRDNKQGVFTLRSIDDVIAIKDFIKKNEAKNAIVIGGGLLGLELANQIKESNLDTIVIEFFPRLLPRQLDEECGTMLKTEIEKRGIKVELSAITEEILGNGRVTGIRLKDGRIFEADIVLIQAGIRPTTLLAKTGNIETDKGIIVDEYLQTSEKDIYAAGDCLQYKNQIWGIIPACFEQSKIVASSVLGLKNVEYKGTTPKNSLKIVGLELTSIGIIDPSKEERGGWEILKKADVKECCYQKIVLKNNKLKGAILFGDKQAQSYVYSKMEQDVDREELKKLLKLYSYFCQNCNAEYDESSKEILFKNLPEDFKCKCGQNKHGFKKKN